MALKNKGRFVWHELATSDTDAAKAFYSEVVGWNPAPMGDDGFYTMFMVGESAAAGMMEINADMKAMGVPPNWLGYVAVDDVDASAKQAAELGGKVHKEPMDIPNMGRFAVIADPQGAAVAMFTPEKPSAERLPDEAPQGNFGWVELATSDYEKAFEFYSEMFGWTKSEAMDMGEGNIYQMYRAEGMEEGLGGMFNKPPEMPVNAWMYYANVGDLDAAVAKVKSMGGNILNGPMEVPGGNRIAQCTDPQGAAFALHGK